MGLLTQQINCCACTDQGKEDINAPDLFKRNIKIGLS